MRLLITGFTGFVSQHFLALLNKEEPGSVVLGIDKNSPDFDFSDYSNLTISFENIDLLNRSATCLLYTSDAADERSSVDLGGRRIIKKKKNRDIS